jgi:hypothetical protein
MWTERLAAIGAALLLAASGAHGETLAQLRAEVAGLIGDARLQPDTVELFVSGDALAAFVGAVGREPIVIDARSTAINGQIAPGRRTYLEFHSDPSIAGSLTISDIAATWDADASDLMITATAAANAEVRLKAMAAGIGDRFGVSANKTEQPVLRFTPAAADAAWFKGELRIEEPASVALTLETPVGGIPLSLPVATGGPLLAVELADPVVLPVELPGGGAATIRLEAAGSGVNASGISARARVMVERRE